MLSCDGTGKVVTVVVSRDVSVTTTCKVCITTQRYTRLGSADVTRPARLDGAGAGTETLPKVPNTPWQRRINNSSDFFFFFLIRTKKCKWKWKMHLA